jgi:hypothetical protein
MGDGSLSVLKVAPEEVNIILCQSSDSMRGLSSLNKWCAGEKLIARHERRAQLLMGTKIAKQQ